MRKENGLILLSLFLGIALALILMSASQYHVIKRIPVPGDYGWDYMTVDNENRRLYLSHEREVVVLDVDTYTILGKIPGKGVHGIAIAQELGRGFISNDPGFVTIFDLKTLDKIDEIRVGDKPNCILFDRKTQRVFTADRGSQRVTAIDAKTGKVAGTIEGLDGKTEFMVADGLGHIFLNMQDRNTVRKIDAQGLKVQETWPLVSGSCDQATSIDMDRTNQRLFIGCRNSVMVVVDATTGNVVTHHAIGDHVDATAFDAQRSLIYFSNGDGILSIFRQESPDKYLLVDSVKTRFGARTMALDQKTGRTFLSVADIGSVPLTTQENPQPRAPVLPGTFSVLVVGN